MTREARAVIGFVIIIISLMLFALFLAKANELGTWFWLVPLAAVAGAGYLAWRFPVFGSVLKQVGIFAANAIGALTSGDGARGRRSERAAVPAAVRRSVLSRASSRCQYPGCTQANRKLLDIHHIDMDATNSRDDGNLIVVCATHHRALHSEGRSMAEVRRWALGQYRPSPRRGRRRTSRKRSS